LGALPVRAIAQPDLQARVHASCNSSQLQGAENDNTCGICTGSCDELNRIREKSEADQYELLHFLDSDFVEVSYHRTHRIRRNTRNRENIVGTCASSHKAAIPLCLFVALAMSSCGGDAGGNPPRANR
jgi:hypothetical protein